eukprot:TRINITY_DN110795_c0_g1_i1.p1 TRINITY_DN110795_c0_g1~~TRINITY_DN110795_c0_g1_i1.p1  ORF type:complete len:204 (+),score=25.02 TRINITY_DN110795_c0_g1_i1:66-614(+)
MALQTLPCAFSCHFSAAGTTAPQSRITRAIDRSLATSSSIKDEPEKVGKVASLLVGIVLFGSSPRRAAANRRQGSETSRRRIVRFGAPPGQIWKTPSGSAVASLEAQLLLEVEPSEGLDASSVEGQCQESVGSAEAVKVNRADAMETFLRMIGSGVLMTVLAQAGAINGRSSKSGSSNSWKA